MNMKMLLTRIHEMNALISSELNGLVDFFKNHRILILSLVKTLLVCTSKESLSVIYFNLDSFFGLSRGEAPFSSVRSLEYDLIDGDRAAAATGILRFLRRRGFLAQYTYLATASGLGRLRKASVKSDMLQCVPAFPPRFVYMYTQAVWCETDLFDLLLLTIV